MFSNKSRNVHIIVRENLKSVWWQTLQRPKSKLIKLNREEKRLEVKIPGHTGWAGRQRGSVYTPPHVEIWSYTELVEGNEGRIFVTLDELILGWCTGRKDKGTGDHEK